MAVSLDKIQGANAWLTVGLREGRNREIRRAIDAIGLIVNRLIRVSYGPFRLGVMEPGDVAEVKGRILRDQLGMGPGEGEEEVKPARAVRHSGKPGPRPDASRPLPRATELTPARGPSGVPGKRGPAPARRGAPKPSELMPARPQGRDADAPKGRPTGKPTGNRRQTQRKTRRKALRQSRRRPRQTPLRQTRGHDIRPPSRHQTGRQTRRKTGGLSTRRCPERPAQTAARGIIPPPRPLAASETTAPVLYSLR